MTRRDVWLFLRYDIGPCFACLLIGIAFGAMLGFGAGLHLNPDMKDKYEINIDREIHYCYGRVK